LVGIFHANGKISANLFCSVQLHPVFNRLVNTGRYAFCAAAASEHAGPRIGGINLFVAICRRRVSSIRIPTIVFAIDLKQEPYEVVLQVRICAVGGQQGPSLPR